MNNIDILNVIKRKIQLLYDSTCIPLVPGQLQNINYMLGEILDNIAQLSKQLSNNLHGRDEDTVDQGG
jgi:hypothetical protein